MASEVAKIDTVLAGLQAEREAGSGAKDTAELREELQGLTHRLGGKAGREELLQLQRGLASLKPGGQSEERLQRIRDALLGIHDSMMETKVDTSQFQFQPLHEPQPPTLALTSNLKAQAQAQAQAHAQTQTPSLNPLTLTQTQTPAPTLTRLTSRSWRGSRPTWLPCPLPPVRPRPRARAARSCTRALGRCRSGCWWATCLTAASAAAVCSPAVCCAPFPYPLTIPLTLTLTYKS